MTSLTRRPAPSSTTLLLRILERPGLVAAVRDLPGPRARQAHRSHRPRRRGRAGRAREHGAARTHLRRRSLASRRGRGRRDVSAGAVRAVAAGDARSRRGAARAAVVRAAAGSSRARRPSAGAGARHGRGRRAVGLGGRGGRADRERARGVHLRGVGGVSADRARCATRGRTFGARSCRSIASTTIGCGRSSNSAAR